MGSFNWEELEGTDDHETPSPEAKEDVVNPPTDNADVDDQMSEVEARLEVASYYRLLLNDHIFDGDASRAAVTVEKEIRDFVRERLGILLNVSSRSSTPPSPFTDDEITALKMVASRVVAKPALVVEKPARKIPTLRKVETKAPKDTLRLKGPQPRKQAETAPAPETRSEPTLGPSLKRSKTVGKRRNKEGAIFEKLEDGTVLGRVDNKVFKHHGVDAQGKDVWLDVTPQTRSRKSAPIPMPMGADLTAVTAMQASKTAANAEVIEHNPGERIQGLVQTAIAAAVQS